MPETPQAVSRIRSIRANIQRYLNDYIQRVSYLYDYHRALDHNMKTVYRNLFNSEEFVQGMHFDENTMKGSIIGRFYGAIKESEKLKGDIQLQASPPSKVYAGWEDDFNRIAKGLGELKKVTASTIQFIETNHEQYPAFRIQTKLAVSTGKLLTDSVAEYNKSASEVLTTAETTARETQEQQMREAATRDATRGIK